MANTLHLCQFVFLLKLQKQAKENVQIMLEKLKSSEHKWTICEKMNSHFVTKLEFNILFGIFLTLPH